MATITISSNKYRSGTKLLDKVSTPLSIITGTIDFSASYPTGGEDMDLSDYFAGEHPFLVIFESKSGYMFEYDYTNHKVKAMYPRGSIVDTLTASVDDGGTTVTSTAANGNIITLSGHAGVAAGPGEEVANATDLSSLTGVRFVAIGYSKV